jgi:hypothetical protein
MNVYIPAERETYVDICMGRYTNICMDMNMNKDLNVFPYMYIYTDKFM